jgi:hypothetical protein
MMKKMHIRRQPEVGGMVIRARLLSAVAAACLAGASPAAVEVPADCDVCVVGAGPAGIGAALASAAAGARTVVLERNGFVGGTTVSAEVTDIGLFHAWRKQVIDGPCYRLVTNAMARGNCRLPDVSLQNGDRNWMVGCHKVKPRVYEQAAREALLGAGIDLRLGATAVGAEEAPGGWRLAYRRGGELRALVARCVVDASGNAAVAALAGAGRVKSDDATRQPGSYFFWLNTSGMSFDDATRQPGSYFFWLNTSGMSFDAAALNRAQEEAVRKGELLPTDLYVAASQFVRAGGGWGVYVPLADDSTEELRAETNRRGEEAKARIVGFLRRQPGLADAAVVRSARDVGVRETYRVVGEETITQADYLSGKLYPDSLCWSFWMIDPHDARAKAAKLIFHENGAVGAVRLGAMVPKGVRGMLVAGRAVSSDHGANSALRVQASCMGMGQVAGVAAALAARQGRDVRRLDLSEVRAALRAMGAIVPPDAAGRSATHVLASLFRELVAENVVAPERKTVLVDFGPNPADGTNAVRHVADLFAQQGATFEQINYGAAGVRALPGTDDAVFVVDAKGTNLSAKAKAFVQKAAAKGGRVLILDMGKDEDPEWLKYLGVSWEKPLPKLMAPLPWNPSQTNEVDQSRRFFTRIGNSGAIAGINNEDLFWWKPDQMWSYYRYKLVNRYPTFLWQKVAGEPVSAYFESADKGTRILTEPGAIAMKTVKGGLFGKNGAVVVATFSLSRKDYGGDHPDKVYRTIKTLLNNMGARTSKAAMPSEFEFVDLKPLANVASWRKPGAEKLAFTWSKTMVDYRFFPVNKCGWSVTAQNFCPAEEFPTVPLSYDGIYFQFINPETNGGKDLLFNRLEKDGPVVIKLPKPVKAKKLHFLGFGMWSKGADVWFGDQKAPVKIVGGDHVALWANNGDNTKRGKKVFSGVWDVPHAERGEKYAPGKAFVYHWSLENPEPNKPIDKITLGYGLAYFAITIEK